MIRCEFCGRGHRTQKKVEECKARAEKKAALEEKRRLDLERRQANLAKEPYQTYIKRRRLEGAAWVNIAAELNRDYPKPTAEDLGAFAWQKKWNWAAVIHVDAQRLKWPEGLSWIPEGTLFPSQLVAWDEKKRQQEEEEWISRSSAV